MNAIQTLAAWPWVERLGWILLHFLWQGLIISTAYAIARKCCARAVGPNGRYLLACVALTAMAMAPLVTWTLLRAPSPESVAVTFTAPMSAARTEPAQFISLLRPMDADHAIPEPFLFWVVAIWVTGVTVFSLRLLCNWILAECLRRGRARPASAEWQLTLNRLKARVSVSRPVRLLVSGALHAPAAMGWLRPAVLVPAGALAGLPAAQIEALLVHELAHIRRHDYLLHVLQSVVEALFFYHPAVWWISGHMRAERELCCDDIAVSFTGDAVIYARALAEFDSARWSQSSVVAANGGSLAGRIARLLGQPSTTSRTSNGATAAQALILLAIAAWTVFAQVARPQFEVASIKPSSSQRTMNVRPLPGRLTADASLPILIQYAYGVDPVQVVGVPNSLTSRRYQIDATADGAASRNQMFLMLQSLLEDRFQLRTHRDTRELPVFALVPAKDGVKLPPPTEDICVDSALDAPAEWVGGGRMTAPGDVQPGKARCGSAAVALTPRGARIKGGKIAMPELARTLSMLLGRPVIDQTGFTGLFDLKLDFVPDDTTPSMPPPPPNSGISDMTGASIAQALRQQLGLRLQSGKGPVQVIVVDQAEPPSGN